MLPDTRRQRKGSLVCARLREICRRPLAAKLVNCPSSRMEVRVIGRALCWASSRLAKVVIGWPHRGDSRALEANQRWKIGDREASAGPGGGASTRRGSMRTGSMEHENQHSGVAMTILPSQQTRPIIVNRNCNRRVYRELGINELRASPCLFASLEAEIIPLNLSQMFAAWQLCGGGGSSSWLAPFVCHSSPSRGAPVSN